jgi:hypothetical protein
MLTFGSALRSNRLNRDREVTDLRAATSGVEGKG